MDWNVAMDEYLSQNYGKVALKELKDNIGEELNIYKRAKKLKLDESGTDKFSLDDLKDLAELVSSSSTIPEIMEFFKDKTKASVYQQIEGLQNMSKYEHNPVEELRTNKNYSKKEIDYIKDCIRSNLPSREINLPGRSRLGLVSKISELRKQIKEGEKIACDILRTKTAVKEPAKAESTRFKWLSKKLTEKKGNYANKWKQYELDIIKKAVLNNMAIEQLMMLLPDRTVGSLNTLFWNLKINRESIPGFTDAYKKYCIDYALRNKPEPQTKVAKEEPELSLDKAAKNLTPMLKKMKEILHTRDLEILNLKNQLESKPVKIEKDDLTVVGDLLKKRIETLKGEKQVTFLDDVEYRTTEFVIRLNITKLNVDVKVKEYK